MEDCTGPFAAKDHFVDPLAASRAVTLPGLPKAPPPTKRVPPRTAAEEMPASTRASHTRVPVDRSKAYTYPSFEGTTRFAPTTVGDAATEPRIAKNHRVCPDAASRARTP